MADDLHEYSADILVVGAGAAGFSAAVTAAREGADVILFESADHVGGTTGLSGGTAWIPNNRSMRENGVEDPRDDALRYLSRLAYPQFYDGDHPTLGLSPQQHALLATFYDRGAEAVDYLADAGALEMAADVGDATHFGLTFPDYGGHLPENRAPRGRHLAPDYSGPDMIEQLHTAAVRLGVDIRLDHQVVDAIRNDADEVAALEVRAGHRALLARARQAVIFGSGGFGQNDDLRRRHLPGRVFGSCAIPTAQGDFVRIARHLGAEVENLDGAWWKQVAVEPALRHPSPPSFWMPHGDAMIQVNRRGRRVVNEKAPYHERGQVHLGYSPTSRDHPNALLFMVFDEAVRQNTRFSPFRDPVPLPDQDLDYVLTGDSFDELGTQIDDRLTELGSAVGNVRLDPDFASNLGATVAAFNGYAEVGHDPDFGRGATDFEIAWAMGQRKGLANPTMAPFAADGPYHCIIVGAGILDTNGGPVTNTSAQVLDGDDQPIPGLYGAGNCVSTPAGRAYWGPGTTIGLALTYGYIAARHAVTEPVKAPLA